MRTYKAQGIVLHTVKYGDSSLVAYILTDTLGRRNYMVQGVKSAKGRGSKSAMLQPMFLLEFEGVESPRTQMDRIRDMRLAHPLQSLPFDVRKSTISLFMAEVLYKLIREVEPNSPLFDFVRGSVMALDAMEEGISNFHLWFLVQLSYYLGFYPANEYTDQDYFDITEGSFRGIMPSHKMAMDRENSALLGRLMDIPVQDLGGISLARGQRGDFLAALLHYFSYHLDAINNVRSLKILSEVF